ncbi:hypothetical protein N7462_001561 [Penicillium macrosclerotiorum]|uniref:uncharacterized protein n=1 Tax=Penicillium macrosclerotiorum TaxID=303699 RepID=UPI002547BB66|nr:uncharacterized protein N7462_001561 [Penicillium macrosclerotiorum]KAJ5692138.1 hypothetical protein N7462_001561 [Penicillium macrosclerotiorum]
MMSGFNPFRARKLDGSASGATASGPILSGDVSPDVFTKPLPSLPPRLPNGYPRKSSGSRDERDEADESTSSDEQTADPFNPDSSVSDNDDDDRPFPQGSSMSLAALDDRPRASFGSAPHRAPSIDGSTGTSSSPVPSTSANSSMRSVGVAEPGNTSSNTSQDPPLLRTRSAEPTSLPEPGSSTSPSSRPKKDKKPPPPPRNHHGKRISVSTLTASSSSRQSPPRSTNRLSFHASSPESLSTSTARATSGTPNASSIPQSLAPDYFSVPMEDYRAADSTDSLHRSNSQQKRPPTPPLSRRHSQMRRSKSTQSKSSGSRLAMSSRDSDSNSSSQPPSPGLSARSVASTVSQDRKRTSMPPPSAKELRATNPSTGASLVPTAPNDARIHPPPPTGRRASSYSNIVASSSSTAAAAPPPPPPPRRARDSSIRSSDGGPLSQTTTAEEIPLPQPSNADDILADLTRLQKEVDDLRGHYESRKVSQ